MTCEGWQFQHTSEFGALGVVWEQILQFGRHKSFKRFMATIFSR